MPLSFTSPYSTRIGVIGAGTMGSGIALAALLADVRVTLYDINTEFLERAGEYIRVHLEKKSKKSNLEFLELTFDLSKIAGADVVIEAVSENLALKQGLFSQLDQICPPPAVLATNTSTLPVTAIAGACQHPDRVGGLHFFNPAVVMPLIEVIQGAQTSDETVTALVTLAEKLGKTPVIARDTPGFIVNRVARPFYGEALRLLGDQAASIETIDQIACLSGGFRMGPFQLMDLIGIDVNFAATESMYAQSFNEPRYRPHPIQAQMVQQKALGVKTGRGFYHYTSEGKIIIQTPPQQRAAPRQQAGKPNSLLLVSPGSWVPGLAEACRQAGYQLTNGAFSIPPRPAAALITAGVKEELKKLVIQYDRDLDPEVPLLCQCADVTLTEVATWVQHPGRLAGFDGLFFANKAAINSGQAQARPAAGAVTLVPSPVLTPRSRSEIEAFCLSLDRFPVWIQDTPALVLPRLVTMLANEAAFLLGEGTAEADTIDLAMRLGANYPRGPLAWARELGYARVVDVLDFLHKELGGERYRVAPLMRRWARLEWITA
jgi:3-hydroxybutyryl-CoA dehydrogenase